MSAPFVGREQELDSLERAFRRARAGHSQLVLVDADPGLGKSSLLSTFSTAHAGTRALCWTGDEAESGLPYGMLDNLLQTTEAWPDPFLAGAAALGHLNDLLDRTSGGGPLLLLLDDLPLADRSSLVALNFLVRRLRQDPVLVVATARTADLTALPASLVRKADDCDGRLTLAGLTGAEVQELAAALVRSRLSGRAAARLAAHTGGNALYLKALLAEVPVADLEALNHPIPAPASFAQLVLGDLAAATAPAQQLAIAAAVLGEQTALAHAAQVAGLEVGPALSAAEELVRLRLIRVDSGGGLLRFCHPLVRAAVYGDLGPATRVDLHTKAAHVLTEARDRGAALHHRSAAATGPDPDLAATFELESNWSQRRGDLHAAAAYMSTAHRLSAQGPDADRRLMTAADLLLADGDAAAVQRYAEQLAAPPVTGRRLAVQARVAWLTGHADKALALGTEAWRQAEDLTGDQRDMLAAMLAQIEVLRTHGSTAAAWARRALSGGKLDRTTASHTRAALAIALAISGQFEQGLEVLDSLPADPRAVPRDRHPELAMRGNLRSWQGDTLVAAADQTVAAWSPVHGDTQPFRLTASGGLALSLFRSGDWVRCQVVAEQALSLAEDMEQVWQLGFLSAVASYAASATGDWATAHRHVDGALKSAALLGDSATRAYAVDAEVLLATCRHDPARVVEAADHQRAAPPASAQRELGMFGWPVHLVAALVQLGCLSEAARELDVIRSTARRGDRRAAVAISRLAGELAAAQGRPDTARAAFCEAVGDHGNKGDALERAMAHAAYGRFLRRTGERRAATNQLRQAQARFASLGAQPFLRRCADELRACEVDDPTNAQGRLGVHAQLTPQERVVAAQICAGRTNRQAAEQLVISVKTVGFHLSNVYAKLGVHNRAQLVAAMTRGHDDELGHDMLRPDFPAWTTGQPDAAIDAVSFRPSPPDANEGETYATR